MKVSGVLGEDCEEEFCDSEPGAALSAQVAQGRARNAQLLAQLVAALVARHKHLVSPQELPKKVFQDLLPELTRRKGLIDLSVYPARARCYAKYLIYNHKGNGNHPFSFTLIVLAPGQETPKHSHRVDCAPICMLGEIEETLYRELPRQAGERLGQLAVMRQSIYRPFEGAYLLQDQPNIHRLANSSATLAMSLHLYVYDAEPDAQGRIASSILHVYP